MLLTLLTPATRTRTSLWISRCAKTYRDEILQDNTGTLNFFAFRTSFIRHQAATEQNTEKLLKSSEFVLGINIFRLKSSFSGKLISPGVASLCRAATCPRRDIDTTSGRVSTSNVVVRTEQFCRVR